MLVHGIGILGDPRKWMVRSPLRTALDEAVPSMAIIPFRWSAWNTQWARNRAAASLTTELKRLRDGFENVVVISHSHGGNIALQAIRSLDDHRRLRLVTMGTPFLRIEEVSIEENIRYGAAYLSGAVFLIGVALAWLLFDETYLSGILSLGLMLAFAAVVLSSGTWLPVVQRMIGRVLLDRRRHLHDARAPASLRMLVAYHTSGDEGITSLRRARTWARLSSRRARQDSTRAMQTVDARFPIWPLVFFSLGVACLLVDLLIWHEPILLFMTIAFCFLTMLTWIVPLLPGVPAQMQGISAIADVPFVQAFTGLVAFGVHPIDLLSVKVRPALIPGAFDAAGTDLTIVAIPLARERGWALWMLVRWGIRLASRGWHHSAPYRDAATVARIVEWVCASRERGPKA